LEFESGEGQHTGWSCARAFVAAAIIVGLLLADCLSKQVIVNVGLEILQDECIGSRQVVSEYHAGRHSLGVPFRGSVPMLGK
jgi:hypothetical protein